MTPLYKIQIPRSNIDVWAKLENQNPTGTHKDRSMRPWILHYAKQGIKEFAISSSGNSAISAAKYCAENKLKLHVFVSPNSSALSKLKRKKAGIVLCISKTPRKDAIQFCHKSNVVNLRASTDDTALIGYQDIAFELMEQLPRIDNIFIPTSSGATLEGIYSGLKIKNFLPTGDVPKGQKLKIQKMPAFFAVQTTRVHPIASYFDKDFVVEKTSLATAIVDRIAHRRDKVIEIIKETGGGGFVISNKELEEAREVLTGLDPGKFEFGWHSALAFAGFLKWHKQNPKIAPNNISVCIFTD